MYVIENCWDEINASECDFGAHIYKNSVATTRGSIQSFLCMLRILDRKEVVLLRTCGKTEVRGGRLRGQFLPELELKFLVARGWMEKSIEQFYGEVVFKK